MSKLGTNELYIMKGGKLGYSDEIQEIFFFWYILFLRHNLISF